MVQKFLEKVYKIVLKDIVHKIEGPKLKMSMNEMLRTYILSGAKEKIAQVLLSTYKKEVLFKAFKEKVFVFDDKLNYYAKDGDNISEIVRWVDSVGIGNVLSIVKSSPTVPPYITVLDLILAAELNSNSLVIISKVRNEAHMLLMKVKYNWEDCIDIRDKVSQELFKNADYIVPVLSKGPQEIDRFDSFNYQDFYLRIYPGISEEEKWRESVKLISTQYIGPIEFPQYMYVSIY